MRLLTFVSLALLSAPAAEAQQIQPSQVGIVYGCDSGLLRRTVVPGPNERPLVSLAPGECALTLDRAALGDLSEKAGSAAIIAATGKTPTTNRSVLIDKGVVVGAIKADPAIDNIPDVQLVLHDEASVGDKYDGVTFTRTYAVIDKNDTVTDFVDLGLPSTDPKASPETKLLPKGDLIIGQVLPPPSKDVPPGFEVAK